MGVRILSDSRENLACLYCSTSAHAFGPVFYEHGEHDAEERAEAFLRWLDATPTWGTYDREILYSGRDARGLTDLGLECAYADWASQESEQFASEENRQFESVCDYCGSDADDVEPHSPCHAHGHLWHRFRKLVEKGEAV